MPRSTFLYLAALSILAALPCRSASRPRYGGTLRIELHAAVVSLDPSEPARSPAARRLEALLFDHLVRLDDRGQPQPALAVSWQHDSADRRWVFRLRPGVRFHDGSLLSASAAAAALQATVKGATIGVTGDSVFLQFESARPELPAELARDAGAVFLRNADGGTSGTGPFQLARWEAGKHASFIANESYWDGRPFVDRIEVELARAPRDQFIDLELGRTDMVEIGLNEVRRAAERGHGTWTSLPADLVALVFTRGTEDPRLREALALSIDRAAMHNVLLQKQGEISGGLLPQWLSGYAFLFSIGTDLQRASRLVAAVPTARRSLTLSYEPTMPMARLLAERVAVNARDAGISLQVTAGNARADLRLVEVEIGSLDPGQALAEVAGGLDLSEPVVLGRGLPQVPEALYAAERRLLEGYHVVPLFHLPQIYGVSTRVRTWGAAGLTRLGAWRPADVWLVESNP